MNYAIIIMDQFYDFGNFISTQKKERFAIAGIRNGEILTNSRIVRKTFLVDKKNN